MHHNLIKQVVRNTINSFILQESFENAECDNFHAIQKIINEEMGVSLQREGYTKRVLSKLTDLYSKTQNNSTLYDWYNFATDTIGAKEMQKIQGKRMQFNIQYGALDVTIFAFIIDVTDLDFVKNNISCFDINGCNEPEIGKKFHNEMYLTLSCIDGDLDNRFNRRAISHELTHIEQKAYSKKDSLIRGDKFKVIYNANYNHSDKPERLEKQIFELISLGVHDCCDFELTAIIQGSYNEIMSEYEKFKKLYPKSNLHKKTLNTWIKSSGADISVNRLLGLKRYLTNNINDTSLCEMIERSFPKYTIQKLINLFKQWIPQYREKIGRMLGKIQGDIQQETLIIENHWDRLSQPNLDIII